MRLMVTLEHNGAEAQFHSRGATVSAALPLSLQNRLYLLMLTAAGNVKKKINMTVKEGAPREVKRDRVCGNPLSSSVRLFLPHL